jgi:virulence factor Mce-like protein
MKRILASAAVLAGVGLFLFLNLGAVNTKVIGEYKIEFDNAFGLVKGADFKVAGVRAGKIKDIALDQKTLHAVITVDVTQAGFGEFHRDAFCQSRPQSLIGEYFVDCQPGTKGPQLPPGSTIPVDNTRSTIPADLLQDVMRMPYRERFTVLINELGAAVAGRGEDLRDALRRAVPALVETDNLLNELANDSHTIQQLTVSSDSVITTLANNSGTVTRFIDEAKNISQDTATQQANLRGTLARLPGFLEQLRPTLGELSTTVEANTPALQNLNAASGQLTRLLRDLPGFSRSARPAIRALGRASVTGRQAAVAATPTIRDLNRAAKPTPELAQNLGILLRDLDNRGRAVEPDSRSPGGQGYTGLEALLQFVFNTANAINTFGSFGHELAVDLFVDSECTPYATPQTQAEQLATDPNFRHCYSWLGPNQPGVNTTDPSNPTACVPDPGGAPPGQRGPATTACRLTSAAAISQAQAQDKSSHAVASNTTGGTTATAASSGGSSSAGGGGSGGGSSGGATSLGQILSGAAGGASSSSAGSGGSGSQTQQLLNYLLAP